MLSAVRSTASFLLTKSPALKANLSSSAFTMTHKKALTLESINPAVLDVQYAVRGELALKADKYMHELEEKDKAKDLPFDKVVTANIGNPQQRGLNQRPITYWRQVISLLENPMLMEEHLDVIKTIYPGDVIRRAQSLHKEIGSVGAYTHSKGVLQIRQRVAKFIESECRQRRLCMGGHGDMAAWSWGDRTRRWAVRCGQGRRGSRPPCHGPPARSDECPRATS